MAPLTASAAGVSSPRQSTTGRKIEAGYFAAIVLLATDTNRSATSNGAPDAIFKKIADMKARTLEANGALGGEIDAAFRLAGRLMKQYNIQHADLLDWQSKQDKNTVIPGHSIAAITPSAKNKVKTIRFETWVSMVLTAIESMFDCKSHFVAFRSQVRLEVTFCGIAPNTAMAAQMFVFAYNFVAQRSAERGGSRDSKTSYRLGVGRGLREIASTERSIEWKEAEAEERRVQAAQEAEDAAQSPDRTPADTQQSPHVKLEASTTNVPPPTNLPHTFIKREDTDSAYDSAGSDDDSFAGGLSVPVFMDDEEDALDTSISVDDALQRQMQAQKGTRADPVLLDDNDEAVSLTGPSSPHVSSVNGAHIKREDTEAPMPPPAAPNIKREPTTEATPSAPIKPEPSQALVWSSTAALTRFREASVQAADDWRAQQDMKLKKGRKRTWNPRDDEAFAEGKRDSKKLRKGMREKQDIGA